jgi:hypothetical protein
VCAFGQIFSRRSACPLSNQSAFQAAVRPVDPSEESSHQKAKKRLKYVNCFAFSTVSMQGASVFNSASHHGRSDLSGPRQLTSTAAMRISLLNNHMRSLKQQRSTGKLAARSEGGQQQQQQQQGNVVSLGGQAANGAGRSTSPFQWAKLGQALKKTVVPQVVWTA